MGEDLRGDALGYRGVADTPVGTLVFNDEEITVRDGEAGPNTERLRKALQDIQYGNTPDTHGWLTVVS